MITTTNNKVAEATLFLCILPIDKHRLPCYNIMGEKPLLGFRPVAECLSPPRAEISIIPQPSRFVNRQIAQTFHSADSHNCTTLPRAKYTNRRPYFCAFCLLLFLSLLLIMVLSKERGNNNGTQKILHGS